jgi:hypothetical protein
MQQAELRENARGCSCSDWHKNIQHLESLLLLGMTHGREYQGDSFHFCPWCGRLLAGATERRDEALWLTCRQRIEEDFFAEDEWGMPQTPNMLVAARPVADYQQATGDILGTLELMLTFVEAGTRFTNQYGDIDEPFYEGLELMLADFRDLLLANPGFYEQGNLAQRLTDLQQNAGWLGWGYGDYVTEQVDEIRQQVGDV